MLTIVGFTSCSEDDEASQEASQIAEVSNDLVAAIRQGDVSLVTSIIADNSEGLTGILNTRIPPESLDSGLTPLMIAARDIDNPELVKLLINNGADAGIATEQGWTSLLYALAFNTNDAVTEEVLRADNPNENRQLDVAYKPADADLLRVTPLSSQADTGYLPAGATALILSTFISDRQQALSKIQLLIKSGVDLEAGDANGRKATLYAAVHHDAEVVNALLGAGAEVKGLEDALGNTVLMHVVEHGVDINVIDALLAGGLPVDVENKDGYTGLQWAAQKGGSKSADLISKLLAGGADVNKVNTQQGGRTALIFAVQSDNVGAVKALLNAEGIDIGQADATGKAALAYATDNAEIAALIVEKSPPPPILLIAPSLSIAPTTLSFTAAVGTKTVAVVLSNANGLSVSTTDGWLTVTKSSTVNNTFEVTVTANVGTTDRSGSVELTPGQDGTPGLPVTLSVTQVGTAPILSIAPTSLSFTTTAAGAKTVAVTLSNGADSWSVGEITHTEGDSWLTAAASSADANVLEVTVAANVATTPRSGSVALTPAQGSINGESVTLSVTQAGTAPSLTVAPTSLSFTASETEDKTVAVTLYSSDAWNLGATTYTDDDGWITVTKSANILTVAVSAHTGTTDRSGSVVLIPAQGDTDGDPVSLSITQVGTTPVLSVVPTSLSFKATETEAKTVAVTLYSADSWSVSTTDSWITATQGTGDDANVLEVTVTEHTGTTDRRGSVVLTPAQGSTDGDPVSLSITQTSPRLTLSVSSLSFTVAVGTKTLPIGLSNADTWYVSTTDSWLTAAKSSTDDNVLEVTVTENTGITDRSGSIALTPAQGRIYGLSVTLLVTQVGTATSLILSPTSLFFTAKETGPKTVTIALSNADSWGGFTRNKWITVAASSTDENVLEVTVPAYAGTTDRSGIITLTPAQDGTNGNPVTLSVTQAALPRLTLSVSSLDFTATGIAQTVTITLFSAQSWTSATTYTVGEGWITAAASSAHANILEVTVTENTVTTERSGNIALTPAGGNVNGEAVILSVTQAGVVPILSIEPLSLSFPAVGTEDQTVTITLTNANSWDVGDITPADVDWITAEKGTGDDVNTLTVGVSAHTGDTERSGNIALTPAQGSTNGAIVTLPVTQAGVVPILSIEPLSLSFPAAGTEDQTVTITLTNANSWDVGTPAGVDWITVEKGTGDDVNTLTVGVSAHTGDTERSGNIALTPAQGSTNGAIVTLPVTQAAAVAAAAAAAGN